MLAWQNDWALHFLGQICIAQQSSGDKELPSELGPNIKHGAILSVTDRMLEDPIMQAKHGWPHIHNFIAFKSQYSFHPATCHNVSVLHTFNSSIHNIFYSTQFCPVSFQYSKYELYVVHCSV